MSARIVALLVVALAAFASATFNYNTFGDRSFLNLVGDAHRMGPTLALTTDNKNSRGAVWFHKRQNVADGFLTNFMVAQSDFKSNGEEGFAFVMHRDHLRYALGQGGEGMGCVGIHDAVSVVFDMRETVVKGESIPNLHIWVINGIGTNLKYDDAPNVTLGSVSISLAASRRSDLVLHTPNMPNGASAPVSHASVNAAHSASAAAALAGKQTATAAPVAADSTAAPTAAPTEAPLPPLLSSFMVVVHDGHLLVYVTNQSPFPVLTVPVPAALLSGGDIGVGFTAAKETGMVRLLNWYFKASSSAATECEAGFVGSHCVVDQSSTADMCPSLGTCQVCARSPRDCGWCSLSNKCEATMHAESACFGSPLVTHKEQCGPDTAAQLTIVWSILLSFLIICFVSGLFGRLLFHPLADNDCVKSSTADRPWRAMSFANESAGQHAVAIESNAEAEANSNNSVAMVPLGAKSSSFDDFLDADSPSPFGGSPPKAKKVKGLGGMKNALKAHAAKQHAAPPAGAAAAPLALKRRVPSDFDSPFYEFRANGQRLPRSYVFSCVLFALSAGSMYALLVSWVVNVSLVEITEQPLFAISYGLLFLVLGVVVLGQALSHFAKIGYSCRAGGAISHMSLLGVIGLVMFSAGVLCFALEKDWSIGLHRHAKVVMYGVLGITLCLVTVFITADILSRIPRLFSAYETDTLVNNATHVRMMGLFALMAGVYYAFVFSLTDLESNPHKRRLELALQIETFYSYPLSALLGAVTALIYELFRLSDELDALKRASASDLAGFGSDSIDSYVDSRRDRSHDRDGL